ncbi:MAG: N-acetylmuramoyl-L-alanine amidase [Bacteroidales bacterium]|nr:N-acetylmuramoyl-L-alanine amidase [Bacteroidales bacterium]
MILKKLFPLTAALVLLFNAAGAQTVVKDAEKFAALSESVANYLKPVASIAVKVKVDSAIVNGKNIDIHFSKLTSDYYFRDNSVKDIYRIAKDNLPDEYKGMDITLYANGSTLQELASKFYSEAYTTPAKPKKVKKSKVAEPALVQNVSRPFDIPYGLDGRHLALWQSHGWYYNQPTHRWQWQRARLLNTVEDLYTQSYVVPFLVPMLENAGANVLLPRERDINLNEVIVDNDALMGGYTELSGANAWKNGGSGFANAKAAYEHGENPFTMGTYRVAGGVVKGKKQAAESVAKWIPSVPETGEYAVYVSYKTLPNSAPDALYTVKYNGGETQFKVNQKMGGGTWIYLGTFPFSEKSAEQGVYLSNITGKQGVAVTADAVKFGGGMGNIARKPTEMPSYNVEAVTSGYPRFTEGARYWLQWAGFADSIYSYTNLKNDYTDDYMSRGRWVNALVGGSKVNPGAEGYNIPVDLSFAFHTDAGTFPDDSIVGVLAIYTRYSNGSDKYVNGKSRMTAREMTDIIQTEITNDIRVAYEPKWSRRGLWDRSYAESRTPEVPAMLLELLSHQNFADMKYGLDPSFRFTVSRAIYKGMLKYLSLVNNVPYTVQPLPVKNFAAELNGGDEVKLSWSPVADPQEPTADPAAYVVYTRVNGGGFDNGVVVKDTVALLPVNPGSIYSYKVVAINDGGASFPSEILSVGISPAAMAAGKLALVVNGFERVSGPAVMPKEDSTFAGFNNMLDNGVPYKADWSFIGGQYEFRREIPWMDDDAPGFGASYTDMEDKVFAGNTFDYPYVHGMALLKNGYSFVSSSVGAVKAGKVNMNNYKVVDMIMGKQGKTKIGRGVFGLKYEVFPVALQKAIADYCAAGGNLLVSGANIATDLYDSHEVTQEGMKFTQDVLKYRWRTNTASSEGAVGAVANPYGFSGKFSFSTKLNDKIYAVESPDALVPADKDAYTIFRYSDNNISAGVAYKGAYRTVSLGFPIETLATSCQIDEMMGEVIRFFEEK